MPNFDDTAFYPPLDPVQMGLKAKCPRCGQGRIFAGVLKFKKSCTNCGLDYSKLEVGDGAVVFVIMIANVIILGAALAFHSTFDPPLWLHILIWPIFAIGLCLWLTRLFKGVLFAMQYSKNAQQGKLDEPDSTS